MLTTRQQRRNRWYWMTRECRVSGGRTFVGQSRGKIRRVIDSQGRSWVLETPFQSVSPISVALSSDTNGMSAGSRYLPEVCLGRRQVKGGMSCRTVIQWQKTASSRSGTGDTTVSQEPEGRRPEQNEVLEARLVVAIERLSDAVERQGNILREGWRDLQWRRR